MKALSITMALALFFSLFYCTHQRSENEESPSDTSQAQQTFPQNDTLSAGDSLEDQVIKSIENISNRILADSSSYFSIKGYFNGYESRADEVWYVDSLLDIQYGEVSWSLEGRSGKSTYYFKNDELIAETEENQNGSYDEYVYVLKSDRSVFGFTKKSGGDKEDEINYLSESDYRSTANSSKSDFNKMISRISEYRDSIEVSGGEATIHIATKAHIGENLDYTEREEYYIDKRILQRLLRK